MTGLANPKPYVIDGETRFKRDDVLPVAEHLADILRPCCERIEIAGSIRRGKSWPKDIELVMVPKMEGATTDLFGDPVDPQSAVRARLDAMVEAGEIEKRLDKDGRPCWGNKHQRAVFMGVPIDLFSVTPPQCASCGAYRAMSYGKEPECTESQAVQEELRCVREILRVEEPVSLQQGLQRQAAVDVGNPGSGSQVSDLHLQALREGVHEPGIQQAEVLLEGVQEQKLLAYPYTNIQVDVVPADDLDAFESQRRRLCGRPPSSTSSGIKEGADARTSPCDGEPPRPMAGIVGACASQERREDRQSALEPGDRDPCPTSRHRGLPPLQDSLRSSLVIVCPKCGGNMWLGPSWGALFTLRTGPSRYSKNLVTSVGWGGHMPRDMRLEDGCLWRGEERIDTPEEADFFAALGIPMPDPCDRRNPV